MSKVLYADGVPGLEDFRSGTGPPLIVNRQTGVTYTVVDNVVVPSDSIIEPRTSDPANPLPGQMWLRTDL